MAKAKRTSRAKKERSPEKRPSENRLTSRSQGAGLSGTGEKSVNRSPVSPGEADRSRSIEDIAREQQAKTNPTPSEYLRKLKRGDVE